MTFLTETVDNSVGNVYNGHKIQLSFKLNFNKDTLLNKDIILKDS